MQSARILTPPVAYFVRGDGERWAVIKLTGRDREDIVVAELSKEEAIERCFALLEELLRSPAGGELPLAEDVAPQRSRQLKLKL